MLFLKFNYYLPSESSKKKCTRGSKEYLTVHSRAGSLTMYFTVSVYLHGAYTLLNLCCLSQNLCMHKSLIDLSRCCFSCLCLLLPGGYLSNSLAIMTDAVHMLTDVVGILFSLLALWLSTKPPTRRFTFGLHRLGKFLISQAPSHFLFPPPLSLSTQTDTGGFHADESTKRVFVQQCSSKISYQIRHFRFNYK